jgi:hypothetical protein
MTLLDVFKPKVRTLEDWSPDVPWSDVDVAALIADMRLTNVPALDDIIVRVIDDHDRHGWPEVRAQAWPVVEALSEADKMRLFGRATLIEAALQCLFRRFGLSESHGSFFYNIYDWEGLIRDAVQSSSAVKMKLDDLATLDIVRGARCKLSRGATRELCDAARVLVEKVPEPMSAAQRRALVDLAEWVDKATWKPWDYRDVLQSIELLFAKIGRPLAESNIFIKDQQLKKIAETAFEYVCEGTTPPLKTAIRGICDDDGPRDFEKRPGVSELQASTPEAKGELLGTMVEAYLRAGALRESKVADFPPYDEIRAHVTIHRLLLGRESHSGGLGALVAVLLKKKVIADDRTSAALLATMPRWDALQDMRVVKIALATTAAGPAPLTRKAAQDLRSDTAATFAGQGRVSRLQALDALGAALEPGACATYAGQSIDLPLPPRPIFKPGTRKFDVICGLWSYYGDLSDFRKCSAEDRAYVEHCLRGPQPRPPGAAKPSAAEAMAAMLDVFAIFDGLADRRGGDADAKPLLERMRKLAEIPQELRAPWTALHVRAFELEGKSSPTGKWLETARPTLAGLSPQQKIGLLAAALDMPAPSGEFARALDKPGSSGVFARAAVYLSADWSPDAVGPILARHAQSVCFQSIPSWGMRDERLGNACLWALIHLPEGGGVPYLARLLSRVKYPKVRKRIEAALNEAAAKAGITRGELDELSIPTHDLDADGTAEIAVGDGAALLAISGTASVDVSWRAANGKVSKSVPAALKEHKDAIKSVKALAKEIEADLSVQPQRLQRLWLDDWRWPAEVWRQRYAQHPLVGALSRRLIWNVHHGDDRVAALWSGDGMSDVGGKPISIDGTEIALWHPIGCAVEEVMAWRARLGALGIVQPFKQAHREVYLVTDAERRTGAYSNRFAGHIVKQHQLMALARLNGWMVTHRIWADTPNDEPTHIVLPRHGLVAEFWTAGAGGDDPEVTDAQAYLYLTTDQLRFYRIADPAEAVVAAARGPRRGAVVHIEDVPPLALSEVMRHCDLFVGVASVANDPNWADGGQTAQHPDQRTAQHRNQWRRTIGADYWRTQAFGDLNAMAKTRCALLTALLPSLAIGKVSRIIDGKFLRVEGKLRAYKIHLGSGNILMEPNDRYLCIVPAAAGRVDVHLPFEGDNMLAIILSKAAMLAADDKITDRSILSQLER